MDHVDVVVVGGSFAGMSAALQLGRARKTVKEYEPGRPGTRFTAPANG